MNRVGVIAAIALTSIAGMAACQGAGDSYGPSGEQRQSAEATAALVQDYLDLADAAQTESMVIDDEFLADALRKLAAVLGTLNLGDLELQVDLRVAAEHVVSDPQPAGTTVAVRNSLISAAAAMDAGGADDTGVRQSAESLRPDRPLRDQVTTIRSFLRLSGAAVRNVARG